MCAALPLLAFVPVVVVFEKNTQVFGKAEGQGGTERRTLFAGRQRVPAFCVSSF